jgi:hypothetical protein
VPDLLSLSVGLECLLVDTSIRAGQERLGEVCQPPVSHRKCDKYGHGRILPRCSAAAEQFAVLDDATVIMGQKSSRQASVRVVTWRV